MQFKKLGSGAVIAIVITGIMLIALTAGLLTTSQTLSSIGSITPIQTPPPQTPPPPTPTPTPIQTIGVSTFSDSGLTTPMSSITWGTLNPGGQTTVTIYIKNTGNTAEALSMSTSNWSPANANTYLTISWVPTVTNLAAGASTSATITLAASSSASAGSFNVNIVITGSA